MSKAEQRMPSRSRRTVAAATRAQSRRGDGRGAPARRLLLGSFVLVLFVLGFTAAAASAAPPSPTVLQVSNVTYSTVHVKGEVDPKGEFTEWFFEVSKDGTNWERKYTDFIQEPSGPQTVEATLGELRPGTTYEVRLSAQNYSEFVVVSSPEPNLEFTTESLPAPSVSIDPVTTFTGTTAHFTGEIDPNTPSGNPEAADVHWHFVCTPECPGIGEDKVVKAEEGNTAVETDAKGLEPNTTYEVTLVGKNAGDPVTAGPVSFKTAATAPGALTIPAFVLEGGTSALVGARVNPHNSATTWWIEYGTSGAYGQYVPVSKDAPAGSGNQYKFLTQALSGLSLGTTYHFRVSAKNATGEVHGEDRTFITPSAAAPPASCPNEALRTRGSANLPDCRAYEIVNPLNLNGVDTHVWSGAVADNGEAALWDTSAALPSPGSNGVHDTYLAKRTPSGWTSSIITMPATLTKVFYGSGGGPTWHTPNLDGPFIWWVSDAINPEDPDDTRYSAYFQDIYRREVDGSFVQVNKGSDLVAAGSDDILFQGATPDGLTVYFTTHRQYEPDAPNGGIYIRSGQTTSVMKDENGEPLPLGFASFRTLLSKDGSLMAVTTNKIVNEVAYDLLYVYKPALGHAVLVGTYGYQSMGLRAVASDGSKIILTSTEQLTPDDTDSSSDIYEYDVATGTFKRLSGTIAGPGPGNGGADAQPIVISPDGSSIYFTSTEQLDGSKGLSGEANLYLAEGGAIHYVATLSGGLQGTQLSGDGKDLLFVSSDRLTAYDNAGHTEVYEYDSNHDTMICVSCRPDGAAPESDSNFGGADYGGGSAEQNIDQDGDHIFFQSPEALLPKDTNGKTDVYEYTASTDALSLISTGESTDNSYYAGTSLDGRDVFFTTAESLLPNDQNAGTQKLFDARIDGGFAEPPPPPAPCEGEGCRGAGSAKAPAVAAPTSTFSGPGNPKPKPKKHHKKHHHKKHKKGHKKAHAKSNKRDANSNGRTGR